MTYGSGMGVAPVSMRNPPAPYCAPLPNYCVPLPTSSCCSHKHHLIPPLPSVPATYHMPPPSKAVPECLPNPIICPDGTTMVPPVSITQWATPPALNQAALATTPGWRIPESPPLVTYTRGGGALCGTGALNENAARVLNWTGPAPPAVVATRPLNYSDYQPRYLLPPPPPPGYSYDPADLPPAGKILTRNAMPTYFAASDIPPPATTPRLIGSSYGLNTQATQQQTYLRR